MRNLILLAALTSQRVIGNNGTIPWRDNKQLWREDMNHFRQHTLGKAAVMGRTTYESIGRALPHRHNVVLSHSLRQIPGILVCSDIESALANAASLSEEVFIIGGQQLYEQTIFRADKLVLTEIEADYEGDRFFPPYKETGKWEEQEQEPRQGYRFVTYRRIAAP